MRLERLVLNNWPPLASHVCALILGVVLANIAPRSSRPATSWNLRPGWTSMRVPKTQLKSLNVRAGYVEVVMVAIAETGEPRCRLVDGQLLQAGFDGGPIVMMPIPKAPEFVRMLQVGLKLFAGPALYEKAASELQGLPVCARGGEVHFGVAKDR